MSDGDFSRTKQGKIQQLGFDEIITNPVDTRSCSICLQRNQAEALLALIEPIGWVTRWYSSSNADIDRDIVEAFAAQLRERIMDDCCGNDEQLTRITDEGVIEISDDGGETWIPDDGGVDPRIGSPEFPPLPGSDDDDKKCVGANNTLAWFQNLYTELADQQTAGATIITLIGIAVTVFLTIIAAPAVAFLGPFFMEFISGLIAITGAVWKSNVQADDDRLLCIFFCNIASDASYDDAAVSNILAQLAASDAGSESKVFYRNNIKLLQAKGLTNAARSNLGGSRSCDDCECGDGCDLDLWTALTGYGDYFGHVVSADEEAGILVLETTNQNTNGGWYIDFSTSQVFGADVCCYINVDSDFGGSTPYWQLCGEAFSVAGFHSGALTEGCVNHLQFQHTSAFQVTLHFTACP